MARTPSMSTAECESILGARGTLICNDGNRRIVRKWLTAQGLPSLFVGELPMATLAGAYNDVSGAAIADLRKRLAEPMPAPVASIAPATSTAPAALNVNAAPDQVQRIAALLSQLLAAPSVDETRVRQIMRDELPNLIPVTRIEITTNGATIATTGMHHKQLPELIRALSCGVPIALVGPAGAGKTTAVEQAAESLGHKFYIQGAVQGAHELLGFVDAHGHYQTTPFREAFEHGGTICLDELDAGDPAGILVCNSALANCYMPFPDRAEPVRKHESFNVVANLNTFGNGADRLYVGRNQLDAATLDRFVFIDWRYDETLERAIAGNDSWVDRVQALRKGATKEKARIVISPRASIYGAKLLAAGANLGHVEDVLIWKGTDSELRRRIETSSK